MMNQLLFGESVEILEAEDRIWMKIKSCHDGYEGWITKRQVLPVDAPAVVPDSWMLKDHLATILIDGNKMNIPFAATLPSFKNGKGGFGGLQYECNQANAIPYTRLSKSTDTLNELIGHWINTPYLWGGRTLLGVDCSGFAQVIFKMMGISLLRDAWMQATGGEAIGFLQEATCGDLAFFDDATGKIVHVGILLNDHEIVHASEYSGRVRIDRIDNQGIVNADTAQRTHQLRIIKRYD